MHHICHSLWVLPLISIMNNNIQIRRMQPADVEACAAMMASTPLWQRYGVTQASAAARIASGFASGVDMFVAVDALQWPEMAPPIGFVLTVVHGAFNRSGYIQTLAVSAGQRGTGVGQLLLEAAEKHLGQTAPDVLLLCADFNYDAQRFYQRHGYARIGQLSDYVVAGVAELVYRKRLQTIAG